MYSYISNFIDNVLQVLQILSLAHCQTLLQPMFHFRNNLRCTKADFSALLYRVITWLARCTSSPVLAIFAGMALPTDGYSNFGSRRWVNADQLKRCPRAYEASMLTTICTTWKLYIMVHSEPFLALFFKLFHLLVLSFYLTNLSNVGHAIFLYLSFLQLSLYDKPATHEIILFYLLNFSVSYDCDLTGSVPLSHHYDLWNRNIDTIFHRHPAEYLYNFLHTIFYIFSLNHQQSS